MDNVDIDDTSKLMQWFDGNWVDLLIPLHQRIRRTLKDLSPDMLAKMVGERVMRYDCDNIINPPLPFDKDKDYSERDLVQHLVSEFRYVGFQVNEEVY